MHDSEVAEALTEEHRAIDRGIEAFLHGVGEGVPDPSPLHAAFAALRRHIYLEEVFLFPPLREAGLMMPVMVMLREHGSLWRLMDRVEALLGDSADGADVADLCHRLLAELDSHNGKEEPIIYPHADMDLPPATYDALAAFLDDGSMPAGWVCQAAA